MQSSIVTPVVLSPSFKNFSTLGLDEREKRWHLYAVPFVSEMSQGRGDNCEVGDSHRLVTHVLFSVHRKLVFICCPSTWYLICNTLFCKQSIIEKTVVFTFQVQRWLERIYILCTKVSKVSVSTQLKVKILRNRAQWQLHCMKSFFLRKIMVAIKLCKLLGYTAYFEEGIICWQERNPFIFGTVIKGNADIRLHVFGGVLTFCLSKTGIPDFQYSSVSEWLLCFNLEFICCIYKMFNEDNSSSVTSTQIKHGFVAY